MTDQNSTASTKSTRNLWCDYD